MTSDTKPPRPPGPVRRWWARVRSSPGTEWASVSRDLGRWAILAVPIGIVAGVGAALFYYLINLLTGTLLVRVAGLTLPSEGTAVLSQLTWSSSFPRILLVPGFLIVGGLAVGAICWRAPEVAGHGTDATIHSFHQNAGKVRARVPFLKTIASVITLGTGGSGGREGPVSQIGGGFGSLWADLTGLGDRDRRIALATGMGAGIGAIFRAPLGGAVYSAEILYTGDFEPEVFVPAIIASVVAYSVYSTIFGFHTLFATPLALASYLFDPARLPLYAVLGIVCGAVGIVFIWMFQRADSWFGTRRWSAVLRPAVGAALAGAIFLAVYFALPEQGHFASLSSLAIGYGFVQAVMLGQLTTGGFTVTVLAVLLSAVFLRLAMTSLVVGSGGSAGLFGTSVVVGAFLGTAVGGVSHDVLPGLVPLAVIPVFSIIGMMSFFGGISKAPLGVLIMVVEMAGTYTILPAAMLSIFVAYVATGRSHIYSEQLPSRIQSPAHLQEYRTYFLSEIPVGEIARQDSESVLPSMTVRQAMDIAVPHGHGNLSVEEDGEWFGGVRLVDLIGVPPDQRDELCMLDFVRPVDLVLPSDLSAFEALRRMDELETDVAAVMTTTGPVHVIGLVTRRGIRNPTLDAATSARI
ncbi:MAG: chloride channel protein [Thermoplasmata archaeon]